MSTRSPLIFLLILVFILTGTWLHGKNSVVDSYTQQATGLSQKRFESKSWSGSQQSDLMQKSFPFKQWDSHYSSLGSQKSDISIKENKDKLKFKSEMVEFDTKEFEISKWDGRMADLERQAQVSTDKSAQRIDDKRIYEMMMRESDNYADTGKKLSLKDINRFQFRQNRSAGAVPVSEAGSGDGS